MVFLKLELDKEEILSEVNAVNPSRWFPKGKDSCIKKVETNGPPIHLHNQSLWPLDSNPLFYGLRGFYCCKAFSKVLDLSSFNFCL